MRFVDLYVRERVLIIQQPLSSDVVLLPTLRLPTASPGTSATFLKMQTHIGEYFTGLTRANTFPHVNGRRIHFTYVPLRFEVRELIRRRILVRRTCIEFNVTHG